SVVMLCKSVDRTAADAVREALFSLARDDAKNKGKPDPIETMTYRGLTAYKAGGGIVGDLDPWLLVSNKAGCAKKVADTFLDGDDGGKTLAGDREFADARKLAGQDGGKPGAWAFVRLSR